MRVKAVGATIPDVAHHRAEIGGSVLHYVTAGSTGSPVLLVHGFPETWWAFHEVVPILAADHRVVAVDLRGFGDSDTASEDHDSATAAEDLHLLIAHLDLGPVHLVAQDISGAAVLRLVAHHPEQVRSLTAIEMGLPGYGLEMLANVAEGGAWYIGLLATPGVPEMLLPGSERAFLAALLGPRAAASLDELERTYSRPDAWRGAAGLYRSMLREGPEIRELVGRRRPTTPVLAVGAGGGPFTAAAMRQVAGSDVTQVQMDGVGHYAALEAPADVAAAVTGFIASVDMNPAEQPPAAPPWRTCGSPRI